MHTHLHTHLHTLAHTHAYTTHTSTHITHTHTYTHTPNSIEPSDQVMQLQLRAHPGKTLWLEQSGLLEQRPIKL